MTQHITDLQESLAHCRRELSVSRMRFQNVIESNADGILIVGQDDVVRFANRAAAIIFGRSAEALTGADFGFPTIVGERSEIDLIRKPGETVTAEMRVTETEWEGELCSLVSLRDITDRKQAEREVQRIAHMNQLLLDSLPHPAMLVHRSRKVLVANRAAREAGAKVDQYCWHGFGQSQFIPDQVRRYMETHDGVLPSEDIKCTFCLADEALETGEPTNHPELRAFDRIWDVWWVPVNGQSYLHYTIDITERKEMEQAIRESERKLDSMLQTMVEGMVFVNAEGEIIYANAAAEQILEVRRDGILGRYYHEREWQQIDEEGQPYPADQLPLSLALGERRMVEGIEHGIIAPNGETKWLSVNAAPMVDDTGQINGAIASFRDITQQKQIEQALRDSERRYRTLFDHAGDAIFVHDMAAGHFLDVNQIACQRLGYSRKELLRMTPMDIDLPKQAAQVPQRIEQLKKQGHIVFETIHVRKDGTPIPTEINSRRIDYDGQPAILSLARDVTERKQAQEQIERYAQKLERSNQELEQFAYVVSHDLREPIRMVKSYLELLQRRYQGALDEKADMFIGYAVDGAQRMQEMIRALLSLSRVGTQGQEFRVVDCEAVLEHTCVSLHHMIEENEAQVTHDPLPTVMGDRAQLAQVYQNLIANAIKFQRQDVVPQVHIAARREADAWVFSVADNGIGIDPQQAERIFQIFQRLHTEQEYVGLGIGLALCKRILERHGGRIWVDSEPGTGSTFYFTLPVGNNASLSEEAHD